MANRSTLAVNKLENFKQWLIDNDWKIEQTKGTYEILRARKVTEKLPLIVYKKDKEGLAHLSVSDWNLKYVKQFINSKNQKQRKENKMSELQSIIDRLTNRVYALDDRVVELEKYIYELKQKEAPPSKFEVYENVIVSVVCGSQIVTIVSKHYNPDDKQWHYEFYGKSSVMADDHYPSVPEKYFQKLNTEEVL